MVAFYNQGDQAIYDSGQYFIPQEKYRLNYNAPIIEEEQESIGIPNTNSFKNFSNSNDRNFNNNSFQPYTAQPSGSFVTNRTDYGSSGYLPGTEPEETFIDKAGNLIGRGIASFIPGGNFLMGMVNKLDRFDDLNAQDQAFTEMQMGINEQNIHGMGNLSNQDRYGYNKRSMFGNYGDLVSELAAKAAAKNPEDLTDFDKYYLEKQEEEDDVKNQIDFNNFIRQRTAANKIREAEKLGIKLAPDGTQIHGTPNSPNNYGAQGLQRSGNYGGNDTYSGQGSTVDSGGNVTGSQGQDLGNINDEFARGGRVNFRRGGIASL